MYKYSVSMSTLDSVLVCQCQIRRTRIIVFISDTDPEDEDLHGAESISSTDILRSPSPDLSFTWRRVRLQVRQPLWLARSGCHAPLGSAGSPIRSPSAHPTVSWLAGDFPVRQRRIAA